MSRLNLYEQQTSAQGPRASGADLGAAPAQALEGMGNVVADIGARIQRREELFASDAIMSEVDTWALTALDDFQKRQDITTQQALPEFQAALKQKKREALSKFSGTSESRAALERQLDNQMTQYGKSAISTKIKAGHEQLTRGLEQQFDKSANQVNVAPEILQDSISENIAYVESRKPGMTADLYQKAMTMARAKPIQSAVQAYVANGNWDAAESIMADPEVNKLLDPAILRPLRIDVAVGRGKQEKEDREVEQDRKALSYLLGTEATRDQAAAVAGVSKMPMVQKLNVLRMMNGGQDLPDSVIARVADLDSRTKDDKEMRLARNLNNFSDLPPDEQMWTRIELLQKLPPIKEADAYGNVMSKPNPAWTPIMEQIVGLSGGASIRDTSPTGRPLTGLTSTTEGGASVDTGPFVDPQGNTYPEGTKLTMPDGVSVTIDSRGHAIPDDEQTGAPARYGREDRGSSSLAVSGNGDDMPVDDLYGNAFAAAGFKSAALRFGERLPGGAGEYVSRKTKGLYERVARSSLILQNDIVDGLRGADEKIANQYREELKKIVTIDPQVVNSTYRLRTTYRTFDKELRQRQKQLQQIIDGKVVAGKDEKTGAAYAVNAINRVIARMNVPQTVVRSRADLDKLEPGAVFLRGEDPRPRVRTTTGFKFKYPQDAEDE